MRSVIFCSALTLWSAGQALADAQAMCLEGDGATEAQCSCATAALAQEVGVDEAGLYDQVGTLYLANKVAGQSMGDAWDAAIAEVAGRARLGRTALLTRMNSAGRIHRDAIKSCS
ncbi:MAG: hypothetical protein WBV71_14845 [Roseobacter sp.]